MGQSVNVRILCYEVYGKVHRYWESIQDLLLRIDTPVPRRTTGHSPESRVLNLQKQLTNRKNNTIIPAEPEIFRLTSCSLLTKGSTSVSLPMERSRSLDGQVPGRTTTHRRAAPCASSPFTSSFTPWVWATLVNTFCFSNYERKSDHFKGPKS